MYYHIIDYELLETGNAKLCRDLRDKICRGSLVCSGDNQVCFPWGLEKVSVHYVIVIQAE